MKVFVNITTFDEKEEYIDYIDFYLRCRKTDKPNVLYRKIIDYVNKKLDIECGAICDIVIRNLEGEDIFIFYEEQGEIVHIEL